MGRRSSRDLWKAKLAGQETGSVRATPVATHYKQGSPFKGVVMGIDPSLRGTGLAVIDYEPRNGGRLLASTTLKMKPQWTLYDCLGRIACAVRELSGQYELTHVAVEQAIYVQNYQTAMTLGSARGAAIAPLAEQGLPVFEYPPLKVKQAVVGIGRASKEQVAKTVTQHLKLPELLAFDEADAAATALCHAMTHRLP